MIPIVFEPFPPGDKSPYLFRPQSAPPSSRGVSLFIVPCNAEYAILKEFAKLENTPNVPGLDLSRPRYRIHREGFRLLKRSRQNKRGDQESVRRRSEC